MADGAQDAGSATRWSNWSENLACEPGLWAQPQDREGLAKAVTSGPAPVRVVGAGHSFTPLAATEGTLINLDRLPLPADDADTDGIVRGADLSAPSAWINAGARLRDISPALEKQGLAFRNLGDINAQSLAGAAGTATHGTGAGFCCLSGEITGVRLMTASGDIVEALAEKDDETLFAAQASLGALGVLLEARMRLATSYNLHRRTWAEPWRASMATAEQRWNTHRNYEFFILPHSGYAINLTHDLSEEEPTPRPPSADEEAIGSLRKARDFLGWIPWLRRKALTAAIRDFPEENVIGSSWRLLSSVRETRFNEMEYHLPLNSAFEALEQVVERIERQRRDVYFPIEVRRTAADSAWLSPFQGAPRVSVAIHADASEDCDWFFTLAEPIFRQAGGRPHWGKMHSLWAADLSELYPDFERFRALRREMDPKGRFLNAHLARLFAESPAT